MINFDRDQLTDRRRQAECDIKDVLVWSNDRVMRWIMGIGLKDYASSLMESGVHGALIALDTSFTWESMALALQIPTQNQGARTILQREYNTLLQIGTDRSHHVQDPGPQQLGPPGGAQQQAVQQVVEVVPGGGGVGGPPTS
eukprot:TRINITY_DN14220_c0_g1_i7.p1 TRINITY_DN14220_c0_g1~~TRINITY_DN14220_c0_g1_i7.p1  ORF type:complete len:159 (-),score=28.30 TRINITY_DN14220_c0_g1_i7:972-1397(-)